MLHSCKPTTQRTHTPNGVQNYKMKNIFEIVELELGEIIKMTSADGKISWVPKDPANSDYQAYLESLNDDAETE